MFSVELLLDEAADRAVRDDWARLLAARLPSQGRHPGESNRPHLTVGLTARVTPAGRQRLVELSAELPVPLTVGALLVFGRGPFILSRLALPGVPLLEIARRVLDVLDEPVDRRGTFASWTPHVTLGRRYSAAQLAEACTALGSVRAVGGAAVALRIWHIDAHREDVLPGRSP